MLCAAWERYTENILLECIDKILETNIEASSLPKYIKEYISQKVRESKNVIYPIELADNGWKNLWKGYAINETNALNTPNSENLNKLFKRFLGIEDFTLMWHQKSLLEINNFIKTRGEIAHNGSKAKYVKFSTLLKSINTITDNTIQVDYSLSQYLKTNYGVSETWRESYYRKLSSYNR
nr:HEPN domain-containing protein [Flavobacterium macrobrachii]